MNKNSRKITVLMPVHNGRKYLRDAIESILNQTYEDFEFLIINDGSTDNTLHIIKSYVDSRIKLINNKKNIGLIKSLNKGIKRSKGEYIARMDADDVSFKNRLQTQVDFMEKHKDIGVCGSWAKTFGEKNELWKAPVENIDIKTMMIFDSPLIHPSVIMRKSIIKEYPNYRRAEDYGLWVELMDKTKFYNIPECLIKYRLHKLTKQQKQNKLKATLIIRKTALDKVGVKLNRKELFVFNGFANWKAVEEMDELDGIYKILIKILRYSNRNYLSKKTFINIMANRWYVIVTKSRLKKISVFIKYPRMFLYMVLVKFNFI